MAEFTPDEVKAALPSVKQWQKQGASITRTYEFKDFVAAVEFVQKLAQAAEEAGHHPDIDIRWNKVTLTLSTHSEGGLTGKDFDLARKIDSLAG